MIDNDVRFDGETYDHELDRARFGKQLELVYSVMEDGEWRSLHEITALVGNVLETGVSARLRDLRKEKFGGYIVDRRRVGNLYEYRLNLPASYKKWQEAKDL